MPYRGRLIFPFMVEIAPIDTVSYSYDPDFKEPVLVAPVSGQGPGTIARAEGTHYFVEAQIEPSSFERQNQQFSGNDPNSTLTIVAHFAALESAGLVDAAGNAMIRIGDRLVAIRDRHGNLTNTPIRPVFVSQCMPGGTGLSSGYRNLLFVTFVSKDRGLS